MNGTKKILALLLVVCAVAALVVFVRSGVTIADAIRYAQTLRGRWWTPIAYFAAYALLDVLFVPTQLLSVAAAVIWGWMLGGTIELFAATAGAMLPYAIARSIGSAGALARRFGAMTADEDVRAPRAFNTLLVFRLVPIIPYTALNYVAGLTRIRPAPYALATFVGNIPSTYIVAFFVDSVAAGVVKPRDVFVRVASAGVLLAGLVVLTALAKRRFKS